MKPKIPSNKNIEKKEAKEYQNKEFSQQLNLKNASLQDLRNRAKQLKKVFGEKQLEMMNLDRMSRIEGFKNQNYKSKVVQSQKYCEMVRMKIAERFLSLYKGNQDSPLFFNEHGLSPFQLMLLQYSRYQTYEEQICMICYVDIQINSHILTLPCHHILHRQCAVQHLLYSKSCPGCNKQIKLGVSEEKIEQKHQE